jgi:hypothetical protein
MHRTVKSKVRIQIPPNRGPNLKREKEKAKKASARSEINDDTGAKLKFTTAQSFRNSRYIFEPRYCFASFSFQCWAMYRL